ncbi:MAG TPA: ABC transporter ATP-binding protein [Chloroflexota bacterium]
MEQGQVLAARGLVKRYGSFAAVQGVDLTVHASEIFGLLGPNGAGKTTTVNLCTGLLRPTSGTVRISGLDIERDARAAKRLIGYVPDEPYLYEKLTAREFVRFMGQMYGVREGLDERIEELLGYFGLLEAADNLIGGFSHGMKQKTGLCGMLVHDPLLLVLDEPTVGLDPKGARLLKDTLLALAARGRAVVLCTHILEIAEAICDRVGIMDGGRIVAEGTVEGLRETARAGSGESLEDVFLRLTGGQEEEPVVKALASP